jgi:hypothetical protein
MSCPNCHADVETFVDEYRFNIEYDREYLGTPKIVQCQTCQLCYCNPMPDNEKLHDYYSFIYRSKGRSHWFDQNSPPQPQMRHKSYISTLTNYIKPSDINLIYEIGPGPGEVGSLWKEVAPHTTIKCSELDQFSSSTLKSRGYQMVGSSAEIENQADIVMGLHCLEHFSEIDYFFELVENAIKPNGLILVEVPNCPFNGGYKGRTYDSPHLLFFTLGTLQNMFESRGYEILSSTTEGASFKKQFHIAQLWKNLFGSWTPDQPHQRGVNRIVSLLKQTIRKILPDQVFEGLRTIIKGNNIQTDDEYFIHNQSDSWLIRILARKK